LFLKALEKLLDRLAGNVREIAFHAARGVSLYREVPSTRREVLHRIGGKACIGQLNRLGEIGGIGAVIDVVTCQIGERATVVFEVGGLQLRVALPLADCVTAMEKAANAVVALPSLTLIVMFESVATSAAAGVPESWPVDTLKVPTKACSKSRSSGVSLSASLAVGVKL